MLLKEYRIGTGGWAYFRVPGLNPLVAYSRIFNFVEVNSTFYEIPPVSKVENWRKLVPADFEFSVRAHKSITHTYRLSPENRVFEAFNNMIHSVDLSKGEKPAYETDILYTRLFGKGTHNIYQPTDQELEEVDRKAAVSKSEKIVMNF